MKEVKNKIDIYRSPFISLPGDWDVLSIPKYLNLNFQISWVQLPNNAQVVIIPSHISKKVETSFHQLLKLIPSSATLLIIPEPLQRIADLIDITKMQLEHSMWIFPSSVLTPEEIIQQFTERKVS